MLAESPEHRGRAATSHRRAAHSRPRRSARFGSRTASYTYDPFGRRISKTITQGKASQTTYYIYGEHGLMAEANEQGTLTKAYGFHPDAQANGLWGTNPVWQADISNGKLKDEQTAWHYLHTDNLGTPYLATNKAGQRTWRAYSQAFGEAVIDSASTTTVNLRFPGQYFDEETGTHCNFQRDYNPYTGRYLQADPIGLDGGLHLYRYAYNSPLMYMDPEGEAVPFVVPIIWGVINGAFSAYATRLKNPCATKGDMALSFLKEVGFSVLGSGISGLKVFKAMGPFIGDMASGFTIEVAKHISDGKAIEKGADALVPIIGSTLPAVGKEMDISAYQREVSNYRKRRKPEIDYLRNYSEQFAERCAQGYYYNGRQAKHVNDTISRLTKSMQKPSNSFYHLAHGLSFLVNVGNTLDRINRQDCGCMQ